jgi:general secretion pathway protein G
VTRPATSTTASARQRGFTLPGVLVAGAAVGLCALLGHGFRAQTERFREQDAARQLVDDYHQAVLVWQARQERPRCPRSLAELHAAGLVRGRPVDPWGEPLVYRCPGEASGEGFDVASRGPDRVVGPADDVNGWE